MAQYPELNEKDILKIAQLVSNRLVPEEKDSGEKICDSQFRVSMPKSVKEKLDIQAKVAGTSRAGLLRRYINMNPQTQSSIVDFSSIAATIKHLNSGLNMVGNNINQIARKLNIDELENRTSQFSKEDRESIDKLLRILSATQEELARVNKAITISSKS